MNDEKDVTITPDPRPSTEDLARAIAAIDHTLSEVLVLLYHVVQTNQNLTEKLLRDAAASPKAAASFAAGPAVRLEKGRA